MAAKEIAELMPATALIQERLAALEPEQFIMPSQKVDEGYEIVGAAGDSIKRLFTLCCHLAKEHNALVCELDEMHQAIGNLAGATIPQETLERHDMLHLNADVAWSQHQLVEMIFWHEACTAYPKLFGKPSVKMFDDWTLGWSDKEERPGGSNIVGVLIAGSEAHETLLRVLGENGSKGGLN